MYVPSRAYTRLIWYVRHSCFKLHHTLLPLTSFQKSLGSLCVDLRQESCYTEYQTGKCFKPINGLFNKNICCCSPVGKGWGGERCEACPKPGSQAFQELCPTGLGTINRKDINECIEFPGLCQNGRCKNTLGGYDCKCNKGYALDENRITCIGRF